MKFAISEALLIFISTNVRKDNLGLNSSSTAGDNQVPNLTSHGSRSSSS